MKKPITIFYVALIQLVALIIAGMFGTFLHEYLISINWFNDYTWVRTWYDGSTQEIFEWGARHYWYIALCCTLFVSGLIRIIIYIAVNVEEYNQSK